MTGFIYNGYSTRPGIKDENNNAIDSILPGETLILVSPDGVVDRATGVTRELIGGEPTISRPIVNEYGTNAEHLEFTYALMKCSGDDFTPQEQRTIETWLTSPKFSSALSLFNNEGTVFLSYYGKFTSTEWMVHTNYLAVIFTFTVNGSYGYRHHRQVWRPSSEHPLEDLSFTYNCESDELEEWVYPKMTVKKMNLSYETTVSFMLTNNTDTGRNHTMQITTNRKDAMYIDCKNCMISQQSGLIDFSDLGWSDVGDIYWLRLKPGQNNLTMNGAVEISIEYDSPIKYVGGWLVDVDESIPPVNNEESGNEEGD